jgi:transcriptional regulator with XRE-family HTH domain
MTDETFGRRLGRLRCERDLSITGLAYKAGVTEGTVRGHENGHTASVRFETGVLYAEALDVTPRYLAFGDAERSNEVR